MRSKKLKKAVAFETPDIGKASRALIKGLDFAYIGSEFCQNIFPKKEDVQLLFEKGARKVVLLTPFMVTAGLSRMQDSVSGILEKFKDVEIMINDFGFLAYLNKFHPDTVKGIGRPLSIDFMRMEPTYRAKFFKQHRLARIETDEAEMLHNIPAGSPFKISLHYPFKYAAMSRLCPFIRKISLNCGQPCYGKRMVLPIPRSAIPLIAINNAYFLEYKPEDTGNADRLVEHFSVSGKKPA